MYPYTSVGLSERAGGLGPSSQKYHTMLKQYIVENKEKVSLLCAFWTIWREKNRRNFKNCENQDQTIKSSFLNLFWEWVRLFSGNNSLSLLEFVDWVSSLQVVAAFFVFLHLVGLLDALYTSYMLPFLSNTFTIIKKYVVKVLLNRSIYQNHVGSFILDIKMNKIIRNLNKTDMVILQR